MSDERRRHPRVLLNGRCWCEAQEIAIYAQVGNVSEGGLFVRTHLELPLGSRTKVRFRLSDQDPEQEALAEVVWGSRGNGALPAGVGLRFIGPAAALVHRIRGFAGTEASASASEKG